MRKARLLSNIKWKLITGYPNYKISSEGIIINHKTGRVLKLNIGNVGYLITRLYNNGVGKSVNVHTIMAREFLKHDSKSSDMVIKHIDSDKTNNRLENLKISTLSEATNKLRNRTSKYPGVARIKNSEKYSAICYSNGKAVYLGSFNTEEEAYEEYREFKKNNPNIDMRLKGDTKKELLDMIIELSTMRDEKVTLDMLINEMLVEYKEQSKV